MNIVNVGYDSTNYYVIEAKSSKVLVDCGWPGTLPKLMAQLKRMGIAFKDLNYLLVTHFHPDHAGLVQELKNQGLQLILPECQIDSISQLTEFFKTKKFPYVEIQRKGSLLLKLEDSRKFLASIGLDGKILHTPGHSDDSITLLLDEGYAFTGDLHPSFMNMEDAATRASWDKIYRHKITRIFPGHGGSSPSNA